MKPVYIFGHRNPDTDSICSSIALSYLKNSTGWYTIDKTVGHLNNETKYVLNYFKVPEPEYLNDVRVRIKNIDYIYVIINSDTGYIDGSVSFNKEDTTDFITIDYGADGYYNKIDWIKKLDSNIQYMREDSENFYGIKDNGIVQIIEIQNKDENEVKNLDELNEFMKEYLTNN